jgi:hypothetical protein
LEFEKGMMFLTQTVISILQVRVLEKGMMFLAQTVISILQVRVLKKATLIHTAMDFQSVVFQLLEILSDPGKARSMEVMILVVSVKRSLIAMRDSRTVCLKLRHLGPKWFHYHLSFSRRH